VISREWVRAFHHTLYAGVWYQWWLREVGACPSSPRWVGRAPHLLRAREDLVVVIASKAEVPRCCRRGRAQTATGADLETLIREHRLTHEMLPTNVSANPRRGPPCWSTCHDGDDPQPGPHDRQWAADATVAAERHVIDELGNEERIRKARVHPIAVLALLTYKQGTGARETDVDAVRRVVDALDAAFYTAFGNVEPIGKSIMLALDVSARWP